MSSNKTRVGIEDRLATKSFNVFSKSKTNSNTKYIVKYSYCANINIPLRYDYQLEKLVTSNYNTSYLCYIAPIRWATDGFDLLISH